MKTQTKIFIAIGVLALGYYFYNKNKPKPTKSNDANFSNFGNATSCEKKFCPPSRPYANNINGRCICQTKPRTRQTFENPNIVSMPKTP